jgi:RimJ/RimL family protein N-acetyltransferase
MGTERSEVPVLTGREWHDDVMMSVLEDEWRALRS